MKRIKSFYQLDTMDCGPASLKIIAYYHGKTFSMKYLRDLCNITREGVSLSDISKAAGKIGLRTLALKMSYEDLAKKIPLPCIVHWNYSHFIVVYKITKKRVYVTDPQIGKVSYSIDEFCKSWKKKQETGYILVLEPGLNFYKTEDVKGKRNIKEYFNYLKPHKNFLGQVFFGMIIGVVLSLIFPFITQAIVDIGIGIKDYNFIYMLLFASVVLTFSSAISQFVQARIMLFVSDRVNITMVSDFITKLLKLPVPFFERKMTSDILARIGDHGRIQGFIFSTLLSISVSILSFIVYSIILACYSMPLLLIFVVGSVLYMLWILLFLKKRKKLDYEYFEASVINQNEILQMIDGIYDIKANGLQHQKQWDWERSRIKIFGLNFKMLNIGQLQSVGVMCIDQLKSIFIIFFTADAVIQGNMTLGMMMSVQYIIGQMNGPVGNLIGFIQSYQDAKISLERVGEITQEEKEEIPNVGMPMPMPEQASINIKNLSFSYHQNLGKVLDDINIHIPAGKTTAIVGASGSGKSTLMKILLRFYDEYDGKITVGLNTDLQSINLDVWRADCGSIFQDGKIFSDTILNNITLYDQDVDIHRLNKAVDFANLSNFIESLPLKLYTMLGHGGNGISAGQAQRILIARAIYKRPKILLMDEATNSLDAKNEKEITLNILNEFEGTTMIVIAHRLSTIKTADQIVVLEKGKVAEKGTHNELMSNKGYYFELISNQLELD